MGDAIAEACALLGKVQVVPPLYGINSSEIDSVSSGCRVEVWGR